VNGLEKWLLKLSGVDATYHALDALYSGAQTATVAGSPSYRRAMCTFLRDDGDDVTENIFDIVNLTGGSVDNSWITADYTGAEARILTFYQALVSANIFAPGLKLQEVRWYPMPQTGTKDAPTPPLRIHTFNESIGGGTQALPHQVALTVTKVVASRRHWGRVYLGPLNVSCVASLSHSGALDPTRQTAIADAFQAFLTNLTTDQTPMVVTDRAHGMAQMILGCRVDNVFDVQRRRRQTVAITRQVRPTP